MVDKAMDELQMIISGRIKKDGKEIVRVSFFRGKDYADGVLPDCVIEKSEGFERAEQILLEQYLKENCQNILVKAKEINPMKNWLGLK
ncbi:MAG: hypothetical protein PUA77_04190 [Lachnospiraceae bacterium]|nr:hypothetical protein [Agathobacter sp.]MDD6290977.1 hypothetical protein [Lachnospiraceae bacterium]